MSHLGNLRSKNPKNNIFSYININLIRNKFENVCDIVGNNVDVLSIVEAKLDSSFPNAQFLLPGFQEPLGLDINHRSPQSQGNQYFLDILGDLLDFNLQDYDSKVILGDFNLEPSNSSIVSFMNNQNLFNLVKSNTCFKGTLMQISKSTYMFAII